MAEGGELSLALMDMMWIAFFFLLRPGEYLQPAVDSHPFRLQDVRLYKASTPLNLSTCSSTDIEHATFVSLTFTTQKNGTRGELIGHGLSGAPIACPVRAVARRVLYLRQYNAPFSTPLCAVGAALLPIVPSQLTQLLRTAVISTIDPIGISPTDINAKSLRSTGAMALLNRDVDHDNIQLIGRWKSDSMLRYLHVQAHDLMSGYSSVMLQGGDFKLIPSAPDSALPKFK